ncbi:hypothetical protein UY3_00779 [Chelonia mydas]|uniref:Zinc finger and SCAN domain-containing protein 29 n=1 Tax=Chelonia mydas TaxID=8469 RepID=M7C1A5_CHEMY|nr:hypothetical protein UY3_00779 [Chelonia mydas]
MKFKELRQAYQKSKEANGRSRSDPQTCRFYDELHAILGGAPTTTPPLYMDSCNRDEDFGDKEDEEEEDETILPDSQELFITLDQYPPNPPKAGSQTLKAEKAPLVMKPESSPQGKRGSPVPIYGPVERIDNTNTLSGKGVAEV